MQLVSRKKTLNKFGLDIATNESMNLGTIFVICIIFKFEIGMIFACFCVIRDIYVIKRFMKLKHKTSYSVINQDETLCFYTVYVTRKSNIKITSGNIKFNEVVDYNVMRKTSLRRQSYNCEEAKFNVFKLKDDNIVKYNDMMFKSDEKKRSLSLLKEKFESYACQNFNAIEKEYNLNNVLIGAYIVVYVLIITIFYFLALEMP